MPRWLLLALLTMLLWGGWGVVSKPLSTGLSAWQVQTQSTLGMLPAVAVLLLTAKLGQGSRCGRGFWIGLLAGVLASAGNVACFQAMAAGGKAAAVIPLTSLYPLMTMVLAFVFLRERLSRVQAVGVGLSLLAMTCLNVGETAALFTSWLAFALLAIAFWGASTLLQKVATAHAAASLVTLACLLGFLPVAGLAPLCQPMTWNLPGVTWALLLSLGLFFALGNLTLILSYGAGGRASVVTPLSSLYSVVTIPLAMLLLHERVSLRESFGIALTLVAVLALCQEAKQAPAARNHRGRSD